MSLLRVFVGTCGGLVALFAGGCTLYTLTMGDMGPIPLVIGGIPAAIGAAVAVWAFRKAGE
jgi:hypothetical protein